MSSLQEDYFHTLWVPRIFKIFVIYYTLSYIKKTVKESS